MAKAPSTWKGPWTALALALVAGLGLRAAARPTFEWDLLAYVGCALELRGLGEAELHRRAYAELDAHAPPAAREELVASSEYRAAMRADARAFAAQLPYYRARIAYTAPIAALSALGLSPLRAAFGLSLAAALVGAALVLLAATRSAGPRAGPGVGLLVLLASGWNETARLATPDALATTLLLLGALELCFSDRRATAALAFVLATLARADAALLGCAVLVGDALDAPDARARLRSAAPWIAVLVATPLLAARIAGAHGWWTTWVHSFEGWRVDPRDVPAFALGAWARQVGGQLGEWISPPPLFVAAGLALVAFAARVGGAAARRATALAIPAALALRFALFPALWPRLCGAHVALAGLLAVSALAGLAARRARGPMEP